MSLSTLLTEKCLKSQRRGFPVTLKYQGREGGGEKQPLTFGVEHGGRQEAVETDDPIRTLGELNQLPGSVRRGHVPHPYPTPVLSGHPGLPSPPQEHRRSLSLAVTVYHRWES